MDELGTAHERNFFRRTAGRISPFLLKFRGAPGRTRPGSISRCAKVACALTRVSPYCPGRRALARRRPYSSFADLSVHGGDVIRVIGAASRLAITANGVFSRAPLVSGWF